MIAVHHSRLFVVVLLIFGSMAALCQENSSSAKRDLPPDFRVSDPQVRTLWETADELTSEGKLPEAKQAILDALARCAASDLVADKAIVEDRLASIYFTEGKVSDAKAQWEHALSDGSASHNLALQADVLVAIASLSQTAGDMEEALKLTNRAVELARNGKSLYVTARALGELGRLQLTAGKKVEARVSIEEALQIDRANKYKWEASHLLYLSWILAAESDTVPDKAIDIATSARDLAIADENYLVFMQASTFIGQAYVHKGDIDAGIQILEQAKIGKSSHGESLFKHPATYQAVVALPFGSVIFLEALAMAYQEAQRNDEALATWQALYNTGKASGFTLALAEAASAIADLARTKKDLKGAVEYYSLAAQAWKVAGNDQKRIQALTSEALLLFQLDKKDNAVEVDEELFSLAKTSKNIRLQFSVDLSIAEALDGTDKLERVQTALKDAESLVTPEIQVAGVTPALMAEFYIRFADLYAKRNDVVHALISLEKAITPATELATAPADRKNTQPLAWLVPQLEADVAKYNIKDVADKAYLTGHLADALTYYELLRYFDEIDAAWKGGSKDYFATLSTDVTNTRLLQLPLQLISKDDATALAHNIEEMGPIAYPVRLNSLGLLTNYYLSHGQPNFAAKFGLRALPDLKPLGSNAPSEWQVTVSCELAGALMLAQDNEGALEVSGLCLAGAKRLANPQLLQAAHQTNVWILDALGKHDEAQESIQYLLNKRPEDPLEYAQLAQLKAAQGESSAAVDAWKRAIPLYESHQDLGGAANAHLAIANLLSSGTGADPKERRSQVEAALALYTKLSDIEGEVKATELLGQYYANKAEIAKAHDYFEKALTLANRGGRSDLEAGVLAQIGSAYQSSGDAEHARQYFQQSIDLYHQLGDLADEAFQFRNLALALSDLDRPDEALAAALKAKSIADASKGWFPRYWANRTLAQLYGNEGDYQRGLEAMQRAREISDSAKQPLSSAWAALGSASYLETIGSWQLALEQVMSAVPVLQRFRDQDDEVVAYVELMAIYGARESDVKDLNKALEFYQKAYQLVAWTDPRRAALLNIDIVEIYWEQGRFKEAISKAEEALEYYKQLKDELGEAGALISLAEAQRSDGDLQSAARNLQLAEPLVIRTKNFYTTGRLYYGQAGLLRKQGKFKEAAEQYERVIDLLERFKDTSDTTNRRSVSETYSFIYDELVDTYYSVGSTDTQSFLSSADKALKYTELNKSRNFAASWGLAFTEGLKRQVPAPLQERERQLLLRQTALQSELEKTVAGGTSRSTKDIETDLDSVSEQQSDLIRQLRTASPAYAEARYPQHLSLTQLPVRSDELFVEFKVLHDGVLIWMIGGSEGSGAHLSAFYKVDRPKQWFEKRIFAIRDAFNTGHPEQFNPRVCDELFNALFPEPFVKYLDQARFVSFVPDDILFLLPLEMLSPRASKGEFVLMNTPTEYFPSAAAFRLSRTAGHTRSSWQEQFIGIADPITSPHDDRYIPETLLTRTASTQTAQHDTLTLRGVSVDAIRSRGLDLDRIPGTAAEVKAVAKLFPGGPGTVEVRMGMEATKRELMQTDLAEFRYVHFATHGVLPVEAAIKEPALVLSYDGERQDDMLLTLSEVFELKLQADMVVLSACNTGSGKVTRAEGVASIGTTFLAAGASSVAMSLWQVSDSSTALFMQEFYRNLLAGKPKATALALARSKLVSKGYDNPFFWAPFILTGE